MSPRVRSRTPAVRALALMGVALVAMSASGPWATSFTDDPAQLSNVGRNEYFILEPGHFRILRGDEEEITMTVLDETKRIGNVETRVVQEYETSKGQVIEISRNYFAVRKGTNDVLYFGEDVNLYKDGKVVSHEGTWQAGRDGAKVGMVMPGQARVGARYYQEQAPRVAMDRAEIVSRTAKVRTPAGTFENCLQTAETSPLIKGRPEHKYYAPGIGLIKYESLELVEHGFRKPEALPEP